MQKLLIIGGVSRSGTTATLRYLSEHPSICRSNIKETRYFLGDDIDPQLPRLHRYEPTLADYVTFYGSCSPNQIWCEATPHYLYSADTPNRIYSACPQAQMIFLLREPISRMVSWYRFAQQKGMLLQKLSFAAYIAMQDREPGANTPHYLRTMAEGRYARYLARWLDVFPREQILILNFNDLQRDPCRWMQRIASFAGIDAGFYDGYQFEAVNSSFAVRSPWLGRVYSALEWRSRQAIRDNPLRPMMKRFGDRVIFPLYSRINAAKAGAVEIPMDVRATLEDYYRDEPRQLADVLGLNSWEWASATGDL